MTMQPEELRRGGIERLDVSRRILSGVQSRWPDLELDPWGGPTGTIPGPDPVLVEADAVMAFVDPIGVWEVARWRLAAVVGGQPVERWFEGRPGPGSVRHAAHWLRKVVFNADYRAGRSWENAPDDPTPREPTPGLTVADLRKAMVGLPDEAAVVIECDGAVRRAVSVTTANAEDCVIQATTESPSGPKPNEQPSS